MDTIAQHTHSDFKAFLFRNSEVALHSKAVLNSMSITTALSNIFSSYIGSYVISAATLVSFKSEVDALMHRCLANRSVWTYGLEIDVRASQVTLVVTTLRNAEPIKICFVFS